ncbi:HD domain-containing protein [Candidatus Woesearchaeota archaeon]|jgi:putative hydrolases of HD superfamily|nr:HD domain-containing protein [Candidatus Woesearchaeota archaeon]MBT7062791.1 HD domain-containing protein [Candidatus Woesearchaeota archaeon]MBT7402435.1 HD domain-containing protein [Candidatus Woesearchaeota archaeon]
MDERKTKIIAFLREIDKFKFIIREIYRTDDKKETNSDHVWHIAMFLLLFEKDVAERVDILKCFKMILIHDIVEMYAGDTFAFVDADAKKEKEVQEIKAAEKLFGQLPEDLGEEIHNLWKEYEAAETKEARFVKGLDRLQAFNQNIISNGRIWWERNVTFDKAKDYKQEFINSDELLTEVYNDMLEEVKKIFDDKNKQS